MKRFQQSTRYAQLRSVLGGLYTLLGAAIITRTVISGLSFAKIPALALGGALIGLGILRVRDYVTARKGMSA